MNRFGRTATLTTVAPALCGAAVTPSSTAEASDEANAYVVVLKDSVTDPAATAAKHVRSYGGARTAVFTHALKGYAARMTGAQAADLKDDPTVRYVTKERTFRLPATTHRNLVGCKQAQSPEQCLPDWADRIDAERSSTRSGTPISSRARPPSPSHSSRNRSTA